VFLHKVAEVLEVVLKIIGRFGGRIRKKEFQRRSHGSVVRRRNSVLASDAYATGGLRRKREILRSEHVHRELFVSVTGDKDSLHFASPGVPK
jgi:hypothetical protein